jgi:hypothetical protein
MKYISEQEDFRFISLYDPSPLNYGPAVSRVYFLHLEK